MLAVGKQIKQESKGEKNTMGVLIIFEINCSTWPIKTHQLSPSPRKFLPHKVVSNMGTMPWGD